MRFLVVDDDPKICLFFSQLIDGMGYHHDTVQTLEHARQLAKSARFDLVLLDLDLPDGNGLTLLPELTSEPFSPEVIIVTGTGDARGAELAFKYGAWDYIQKPFLLNEVILPINRALQYRREKQANEQAPTLVRDGIIGKSGPLLKVLQNVAKAAKTDISLLITGETGTGKELFARALHANSRRRNHPFVAVDCGALPDTLVESTLFGHEKGAFTGAGQRQDGLILQAHGGTLMLDEVGDLPLAAQKSLLRTLQERCVRPVGSTREIPVDIRLVAATHLSLDRLVQESLFREDLLYRIRAMEIQLPPLREREGDIEAISLATLEDLYRRYQIQAKTVSIDFLSALQDHSWPGNVRELVNTMEYALAAAGDDRTLVPKHLPPEFRLSGMTFAPVSLSHHGFEDQMPRLSDFKNQMEKSYLKELLNRAQGNRMDACRMSGISQARLYGLLNKHNFSGFNKNNL